MIEDYFSIYIINIFSNGQIYYCHHNPFAAMFYLPLSVSLLSCPLPATFRWVSNPVMPKKKYHWINDFHWMLFSFVQVAYTKICPALITNQTRSKHLLHETIMNGLNKTGKFWRDNFFLAGFEVATWRICDLRRVNHLVLRPEGFQRPGRAPLALGK